MNANTPDSPANGEPNQPTGGEPHRGHGEEAGKTPSVPPTDAAAQPQAQPQAQPGAAAPAQAGDPHQLGAAAYADSAQTYPAQNGGTTADAAQAGAPQTDSAGNTAAQTGAGQAGGATADAAQEKRPEPRRAGVGTVAAVAVVAALIGGATGAGIFAAVNDRGPVAQAPARVGSELFVNDVENATVITGVAASVAPSVVTLAVQGSGATGSGSGVVLSEDGYIITNAHVATLGGATGDPMIRVQTFDGRLFDATLVGSAPYADIAVIKVDADVEWQPAEFADSSELNVGDTTIAIGAPLGLSNTVTTGVVSAINRSITVASSAVPDTEDTPEESPDGFGPFDFWEFDFGQGDRSTSGASSTIALPVIQTDASINPGNSGGALLDENGNVIGINVAIASTASNQSTAGSIGLGFAIPANFAQRVASELIEDGTASHGLLGAMVADVLDDPSVSSTVVGAAIQDVTPGGAAETAGLRAGDVVIEFNGLPITNKTDLTAQVRVLAGGEEAEVVYVRNGQRDTVTVTLDELA